MDVLEIVIQHPFVSSDTSVCSAPAILLNQRSITHHGMNCGMYL